jgi:hypothetical protein
MPPPLLEMSENVAERTLKEMQSSLDEKYIEYSKKDFGLKLEHYNGLKEDLEKRNKLIEEFGQTDSVYKDFWSIAATNYEMGAEILPIGKDNAINAHWINYIKVWYEEGYMCCVEIDVRENPFISNDLLHKKFSLISDECDGSKIVWKERCDCELFDFFEVNEENLQIFDVLYELYVNGIFYFQLNNEE